MSKKKIVAIPVKTDDGYLKNSEDWMPEIMKLFAKKEGIKLTKEHCWVVNYLRKYHNGIIYYPVIKEIMDRSKREPGLKAITCVKDFYNLFHNGLSTACLLSGLPKHGGC